ncbi:hypothetical protein [Mycoplasma leonicaptivi]|uniref:hypothetical protein n=1 Tax=Mycoplasma leonicaptivi TaxID=36742 RepID=UPI00048971A8|nr:hypothetical protein [Mycoplasma leonicaptivi]
MRKSNGDLNIDFSIFRSVFIKEVINENNKIIKKRLKTKKELEYISILNKLINDLKSFNITNKDLEINYYAFKKIKRDKIIKKISIYSLFIFVILIIIFLILILVGVLG